VPSLLLSSRCTDVDTHPNPDLADFAYPTEVAPTPLAVNPILVVGAGRASPVAVGEMNWCSECFMPDWGLLSEA
jgi:hypothetical protein